MTHRRTRNYKFAQTRSRGWRSHPAAIKIGYMMDFTRRPKVHGQVGDVPTTRGAVRVLLTDNPTLPQPPFFLTYVGLAPWLPGDSSIAMFITFMVVKERKEVNLVYAPRASRYDEKLDGPESVPVQIGK
jgi:hypothetical protein